MHYYADFWLGYATGRIQLASAWHDRDATERPSDPSDTLAMAAWLRLSDAQQLAIVDGYSEDGGRVVRYGRAAIVGAADA